MFWGWLVKDALGMVLSIFFLPVLLRLGISGILVSLLGFGLGLPPLSNLAGPVQHFKGAILEAWRDKVSSDLVVVRAFVVVLCWIFTAPCSSLPLLMFEKEIRLRSGVSW